jgi:hypothetical protein
MWTCVCQVDVVSERSRNKQLSEELASIKGMVAAAEAEAFTAREENLLLSSEADKVRPAPGCRLAGAAGIPNASVTLGMHVQRVVCALQTIELCAQGMHHLYASVINACVQCLPFQLRSQLSTHEVRQQELESMQQELQDAYLRVQEVHSHNAQLQNQVRPAMEAPTGHEGGSVLHSPAEAHVLLLLMMSTVNEQLVPAHMDGSVQPADPCPLAVAADGGHGDPPHHHDANLLQGHTERAGKGNG